MSVRHALVEWASFAWCHFTGRPAEVPRSRLPDAPALLRIGLGALLHRVLADRQMEGDPRLALAARNIHAFNIVALQRMGELTRLLEAEHVVPVAHKGAAVISLIPGYAAVRAMADIDVLVRPEQFGTAVRLLEAQGGRQLKRNQPVSGLWSSERALQFEGPMLPLNLDIHRRLHHWPLAGKLTRRALDSAQQAGGLWVPPVAECLCIAALHRAKHGFVGDCRDLLDVALLLDRLEERGLEGLIQTARRCEILPGLVVIVKLAAGWFGVDSAEWSERVRALSGALGRKQRERTDRLAREAATWSPDHPLPALPFVALYRHMPVATGRLVPAVLGALIHAGFRAGDVVVRGRRAAPNIVFNWSAWGSRKRAKGR
ncbi:MAG: nucleotidyltransferase family protein [Bradymonadales bacterium]|nr:nucleotidyltransferase family protein [Bradymonadales bacterium]